MRDKLRKPITVVLLAAALSVSVYLLVRSLALAAGTAGEGDVCSTLFATGCDEVLEDSHSRLGGIPLAGWGVLHFAVLLGLLALGRLLGEGVRATVASAAALQSVAGGMASIALLFAIALEEVPLCPLCLVVNGLNLVAVVPVLRWSGRPIRAVAGDGVRAVRYLFGGSAECPETVPLRTMALLCATLFGVVLYQWILIEWDRALIYGKDVHPEQVLAAYENEAEVDIPVGEDDATLGPEDAKATLVVFSDAFCPACRGFWSALPQILGPYREEVRVVFKHFPLDPPCNPAARGTVHPFACQAGVAMEAARRQGRFWDFQSVIREPDPRNREVDVFAEAAEAVELDVEQFIEDQKDGSLKEKVERDVALGQRLGVTATPTLFLNGRRIARSSPKAIKILLERLLGQRESR